MLKTLRNGIAVLLGIVVLLVAVLFVAMSRLMSAGGTWPSIVS